MAKIIFAGDLPTITIPDDKQLADSFRSYLSDPKQCVGAVAYERQAIAVDFRDAIALTIGAFQPSIPHWRTIIQFKGKLKPEEFYFPLSEFPLFSGKCPTAHFRKLLLGDKSVGAFLTYASGGSYHVAIDLRAAVYLEINDSSMEIAGRD